MHHGPWPWWCLGSCGWVAFVEMPLVPELTPFGGEVTEHGCRFRKCSRQTCNQNRPIQYCMQLTSLNIRTLMCLWLYALCDVGCVCACLWELGQNYIVLMPTFLGNCSSIERYWEQAWLTTAPKVMGPGWPRHMNEAKRCWLTSDVVMQD